MLNVSESVYAEETFETVSEKSDNSKFEIEYVLNSDQREVMNYMDDTMTILVQNNYEKDKNNASNIVLCNWNHSYTAY